ncbi:unnamed protein product [Sphenostylis stenocarpa]|uniref:FH2 domain-containing protein n=1 Tax=Sphenostylis stenocarpa TaxID=92480 RepID=A0AA86SZ84_9FABA|nr:unnamed protein product [Sphenostylis stenocarpa]
MRLIITILMFLSLQRANILTVDAALHAAGNEKQFKKISGEDENENKETPRLEDFTTLFGLKSLNRFHRRRSCYNVFDSDFVSLSASVSPKTEAEAPNSDLHVHPRSYHSQRNMPLHKIQQEDGGSANRTTLVAVVVSGGVATLICALGCVCVCKKFRNQRRKSNRTIPLFSKIGRTGGTYRNSDPDLLYITSLKQTCETQKSTSSHSSLKRAIYETEVLNQEAYNNASTGSSSIKEILSVHEELEYDGGKASSGEKTVPGESHSSSDYESFHSCIDSHSSISETERLSLSPRNLISETTQFPCSSHNSTPKVESNQSPSIPKHEEQKKSGISQPSIPPPPCPPPFMKENINSMIKNPTSKQLPKLKPLHWDKVRATPDRTMVWDTLRTNSFE